MLIAPRGLLTSIFLLLGIIAYSQDNWSPYDTLIAKGFQAIDVGDLEPAKDYFYAAFELMPEEVCPSYMLGYCYAADCKETNNNCELAISFLDQAIRIDKFFRFPFYNRSWSKFKQGDLNGALADIDIQIEMDSTNPAYFFLRAQIYHRLDNKDETCKNLQWFKDSKEVDLTSFEHLLAEIEAFCSE